MTAHGIDIDDEQLARARRFCEANNLSVEFRKADMHELPYDNASFDYVYEHFSLCHLCPEGAAKTLAEIWRVLRPGGLAFFGYLSADSWPLSSHGVERSPSVYCMRFEDGEEACHTILDDRQSDALAADWEILRKNKVARVDQEHGKAVTPDEWRALHAEAHVSCSDAEWMAQYSERRNRFTDVYAYYTVRKPSL